MRKLATVATAFSVAVFFAYYLVHDFYLIFAAVCGLLCFTALFFKGQVRLRIILITIAAAGGFGVCAVSCSVKNEPALEFAGRETTIEAEVVEFPTFYEDYSVVTVRLNSDNQPKVKALLYCYDEAIPDLCPGDYVSVEVNSKNAAERYGQPWERYTADNVYLICYAKSEVVVTGKSATAFLYFPQTISKCMAEISRVLFSEKAAPFATALITGDKTDLYADEQLYSDMGSAGILHVVAISGMHVAFLVGFLRLILRKRRFYAVIGIPMVWIFAFAAGAAPSVLRAAFMQSLVLLAPLLNRENDGITSLSAALMLLLLINPDACASVGLQLSFSAMLGIILLTPKINGYFTGKLREHTKKRNRTAGLHNKLRNKLVYAVIAAFSASVGAMAFSTPLIALHFGYVPLYSIFVNILVFWAVSAAFMLGVFSTLLGMVWLPLGTAFAAIAELPIRYIIAVARLAADLPYSVLCTENNLFAWWIVFVYAAFGLYILFGRRGKVRPVLPTSISVCALCCFIIFTELDMRSSPAEFTAVDVGQGQSLILTEGGNTIVVDCGGGGKIRNAGEITAEKLLSQGRRSIDVLALTHFDRDHAGGVIRLMCRVKVNCLVIPDSDRQLRDEIVQFAESHGTEVYIISEDTEFSAGGLTLSAFAPLSLTKPELFFLGNFEECDILVTGDADEEMEKRFLMRYSLPDTEIYVAGHHGSKYSSCEQLLETAKAETAIVSCGYNSYGHPTAEALSRIKAAGMEILRTDILGDVTVALGE